MSGPGRRALIYRAAYTPHLSNRERTALLKIALPSGADIPRALDTALEANHARNIGLAAWAQELLDTLTETPPMEDQ